MSQRSTAQSVYKRFLNTSSYSPKNPQGIREKFSATDKRIITGSVKNDPKITADHGKGQFLCNLEKSFKSYYSTRSKTKWAT